MDWLISLQRGLHADALAALKAMQDATLSVCRPSLTWSRVPLRVGTIKAIAACSVAGLLYGLTSGMV